MDQSKPHPPPGGGDDNIELTEVALDVRTGGGDPESLKSPAPPPEEESLNDLLASLPDLPEDLDIPTEAPPLEFQAGEDLRRELAQRLSDLEMKELVREVIQETVERLARELLPEMAAQVLERELHLLKKRLTEPDQS